MSPTEPEKKRLLIDSHIFYGNSGGPVFELPLGITRDGKISLGGHVTFLGIVTETRFETEPLFEQQITTGPQQPTQRVIRSLNSIAIGVIEPAYKVKKLLIEASNLPATPSP